MPYHTGRPTRQRTQQRQSQAQPNQTTPSVVTPVVTNVGGRFQAQIPTQTTEETREDQAIEEQEQQPLDTPNFSAESLSQDPSQISEIVSSQIVGNPIVEINLEALPGQWVFKETFQEYVGKYHLHQNGDAMIRAGVLGVVHDLKPDEIIVPVEPKPTSPPINVSPMDERVGELSSEGQWVWQGFNSGWVKNIKIIEPPQVPAPALPPDDPRNEIRTRLYPGINIRSFFGLEAYRDILEDFISDNEINLLEWYDYWPSPSNYQQEVPVASQTREYVMNEILKDVPITKISKLEDDGTTSLYFQPGVPMGPQPVVDLPTNPNQRLDEIKSVSNDGSKNLYVIEVGVGQQVQNHYDITYLGLDDEINERFYETEPLEVVPQSLPITYQYRYENEWAPEFEDLDVPNNQFCASCNFFEAEGGYCNNWNAEVRLQYWCGSWRRLEYTEAPPNEFTQFLRTRDASNSTGPNDYIYNYFQERVKFPTSGDLYPSDLHGEPNLDNFLSPFNILFQDYGGVVVGDFLRQAVYNGNAYGIGENVELDMVFQTPGLLLAAMDRIQRNKSPIFMGGSEFYSKPIEVYDLSVQSKVTYTLIARTNAPQYFPGIVKINLLGKWFGEIAHILSQMLITNTKYAYTPYFNNTTSRCVWKDVRITSFEVAGKINIDIIKQNIMNRFLVYANDPTNATTLNSDSALKFMSWVARRAPYSENMQTLYEVLLNTQNFSVENQQFIDAIENAIGEELPNDPAPVDMPLGANLLEVSLPDYLLNGQTNNGGETDNGDDTSSTSGQESAGGY